MKPLLYILLLLAAIGLTWYITDRTQPPSMDDHYIRIIDSLQVELRLAREDTHTQIIYRDSIRTITDTLIINRPVYEAPIIDTTSIDSILRSIYARYGIEHPALNQ